jgi:hypothetical protein
MLASLHRVSTHHRYHNQTVLSVATIVPSNTLTGCSSPQSILLLSIHKHLTIRVTPFRHQHDAVSISRVLINKASTYTTTPDTVFECISLLTVLYTQKYSQLIQFLASARPNPYFGFEVFLDTHGRLVRIV